MGILDDAKKQFEVERKQMGEEQIWKEAGASKKDSKVLDLTP